MLHRVKAAKGTQDAVDRALIRELQLNGRISNVEVAKRLGLTEGAIRNRIRKLFDKGLIRVVAVEDPFAQGLRTHVVISLKIELKRIEQVATAMAGLPELSFVYITAGTYDVMAVAFFASDQALHQFLTTKVAKIPGILRTETFHIVRTLRRSQRLGQPIEVTSDPDS